MAQGFCDGARMLESSPRPPQKRNGGKMDFLDVVLRSLRFFMDYLLVPVGFLIVLLVQLKIIRDIRSQTGLIMFYGKQIEEIRKMLSGGGQARRLPDIPPDETGLYDVLKE
jgi:hypothetical protein